jgi:hypothetical protein
VDDQAIRALLTRLARPDVSGGDVVERAAILAAGADFAAIMAWVMAHGGRPETMVAAAPSRGLHGSTYNGEVESSTPLRFVLPPGTLARESTPASSSSSTRFRSTPPP